MSNLIQWPRAKYWTAQWNPIIGCKPCSPACEHCYAAAMAKRFGGSFEPHRSKQTKPPAKGVCFCGNMTDCFGEWVDRDEAGEWIASCIRNYSKPATYLWLTKRPDRMTDAVHYVSDRLHCPAVWFANNYFGITAESQEWYDKRLEYMIEAFPKWANGFISAEPLLGDVNLRLDDPTIREMIDWVIVGAESGGERRSCNIEWVEHVVYQCRTFNIPVFVKQICLPNGKFTNKVEEFPEHLQIRQIPWL